MAEPIRVVPIVCPFGLGGVVYVYYLDTPEPALVDTGVAASPAGVIEPALQAAGFRLEDVRWILATHGHWDHIGGAHAARTLAAPGAAVALHGADAELLAQRRAHLNGYAGVRFRYLDAPELLAQTEALLLEGISGELAADRVLADGDRIPLGRGITLAVVHTPGHSAGSVSYLLEGPNWAFTGDAVQIHGSGTNRFPLFVDPAAYRASLRRLLAEVRPAELYLGHRLLDPTGETLLESHLAGEAVPAALRGSLDVEERLAAAAAQIAVPAQQPLTAQSFAPAAEALGYRADDPLSWPPSFFATLSGYLAPSESGPPAR